MLAAMNARIRDTIAALLVVLPLACASGPARPPAPVPPPAWSDALTARADALETRLVAAAPAAAGALVVRLAFEPGADLDLYVSDPLEETIYYANTPARSGGALDTDLRCPHAAGVETVAFATPLAGRYRVGIDFQHRCERSESGPGPDELAPYVLSIEARGERRLLRGLAVFNVFASRVDEFVY
jgi:hypothetical protein